MRNYVRHAAADLHSARHAGRAAGHPNVADRAISLSGDDEAELRGYWDGLAEGGQVTMPLEQQMWGDTFGMLTDRYGIGWMVNIAGAGEPEQA